MNIIKVIFGLLFGCCINSFAQTQKIEIQTFPNSSIYIDGKQCLKVDGKFLTPLNKDPKQLKVTRPGYRDEYLSLWQKTKSNFYDQKIVVSNDKPTINPWNDSLKTLTFNLKKYKIKDNIFKVNYFPNLKNQTDIYSHSPIYDLIFEEKFRRLDLSCIKSILQKNNYENDKKKLMSFFSDITLDLVINELTYIQKDYDGIFGPGSIAIETSITWLMINTYGDTIHKTTNKAISGQFCYKTLREIEIPYKEACVNSIENNLIEFVNNEKKLNIISEESFQPLFISTQECINSTISKAIESSVTIQQKDKKGSGFIINENGYIITLAHLISDTSNLKVVLNNGKTYIPKIIRFSPLYNLALIKVDTNQIMVNKIKLNSNIEIATDIFAVGNNHTEKYSHFISKGIISGVRKLENDLNIIQTDAGVNINSQGGAIININGDIIGIIYSKLTGIGIEGVTFGIPIYEVFEKLNIKIN